MSFFHKTMLIIIALAYLVSPVDLIPDLLIPYLGWIDDAFLIGMIIYYFRFGTLPPIFSWPGIGRKNSFGKARPRNFQNRAGTGPQKNAESQNSKSKTRTRPNTKYQERYQKSPKTPHEILGVKPGASREEIHKAYKKAAKEYHPDRVAHLGKDLQILAKHRFIEIKDAYNSLTGASH